MRSVDRWRAPGRGRYDRDASASERRARAKSRLLRAIALTLRDEGAHATVSDVVERAGVGRNTFYEHFADLEHAAAGVRADQLNRIVARLDDELARHRTPHQKVRALVGTWLTELDRGDEVLTAALLVGAEQRGDAVHAALADRVRIVAAVGKRDGAFGASADALRIDVAVSALVRSARALMVGEARLEDAEDLAYDVVCAAFR